MSVLTAAVVLAWICLVILTLAMAGMLRQIREMQADIARLVAPRPRGAAGRTLPRLAGDLPLVLLVLDPGCGFCEVVAPAFARLAGTHPAARFEMLAPHERAPTTSGVRCRVDPDLVAELDLPWAPALVVTDPAGTVRALEAVREPDGLDGQVTSLLRAELSTPEPGR